MISRFLKYAVLAVPLLLAGCGDGWEMVRTTDVFPYGNQRTAGSGIMYVRAKLAPPEDLKIVSVKRDYTPSVAEDLRVIFDKAQRK